MKITNDVMKLVSSHYQEWIVDFEWLSEELEIMLRDFVKKVEAHFIEAKLDTLELDQALSNMESLESKNE